MRKTPKREGELGFLKIHFEHNKFKQIEANIKR